MASAEASSISRMITAALARLSIPVLRWALVTQVNPLRVRFPGEQPLPFTPAALCRPAVNQQVLTVQWAGRMVVLGAAGGDGDLGTNLTAYTVEDGWSVQQFQARKVGRQVMCNTVFTRTGDPISVPADGNIPNMPVLTITEPSLRPILGCGLGAFSTGPAAVGYQSGSGIMSLTTIVPGATIGTGTQLSLSGQWIAP